MYGLDQYCGMLLSGKGCREFLQLGWQEFVADGRIVCCVLTILLVNFIGINKNRSVVVCLASIKCYVGTYKVFI